MLDLRSPVATPAACWQQGSTLGKRVVGIATVKLKQLQPVDALARFMPAHPMIRIELSLSSSVVDLVQEGFDIAIRVGRLRDSSLVARPVGSETLGLFASQDYIRRRGAPRTPAELSRHELIL